MKWASVISEDQRLDRGLPEAAHRLLAELGEVPDLTLVFPSKEFAADFADVPELLTPHLQGSALIGCSAGGVIGDGCEIEQRAAVTLTAASLPGVHIQPFHVEQEDLPDADSSPRAWHELTGVSGSETAGFILLADPFSLQADRLLEGLDYAYPQAKKIGGLASGATQPGANALYLGGRVWGVGAVGVALSGNIKIATVVAQGCRPIGEPMRVTASRDNVLIELDHRPPIDALRDIYESLSSEDQDLARTALHLGVLTHELTETPQPGGFLIRNIIGIDPQHGVMAVGERLRDGQTVQFHLRDAGSSAEDLDQLLKACSNDQTVGKPAGALLFSCLGRGMHLYGKPDHDTDLFRKRIGVVPLGGFFCNGEIGPVGGSTYVHGFTSSFGIFAAADS